MEVDKFLHVGHVGTVWSYAETWIAFSELFHGPACYSLMASLTAELWEWVPSLITV